MTKTFGDGQPGCSCRLLACLANYRTIAFGKPCNVSGHREVIKESCKSEMPDEFAKQQRAYLDSKLKDDTTYKNPEEVLAALNLK